MTNEPVLDIVKEMHNSLYNIALQTEADHSKLSLTREDVPNSDLEEFKNKVDNLLEDIRRLSEEVDSFEDYRWLSDAIIKWQFVYSKIFGTPNIITLSQPKNSWLPQPPVTFSEEENNDWIKRLSEFMGFARGTETGRKDSNAQEDWHTAEVFFASEILEGRFNFASRISPKSYWRLENIWLKEVKTLKAYFHWVKMKRLFSDQEIDFNEASNQIRKMLINEEIKAHPSEFLEPKKYIQERYLGSDGIHLPKKRNAELDQLIERKAFQIYTTTGTTDNQKNWTHAETYVKMFYENIIPAIQETDSDKSKERVLRVLKAFQYSKMNRFIIINCFETALAIYFIDPKIIKDLWKDSEKGDDDPEFTVESIVDVDFWPERYVIPESCIERFWFEKARIGYKGVMLDSEKELLRNALEGIEDNAREAMHKDNIDSLCAKSRKIRERTTL